MISIHFISFNISNPFGEVIGKLPCDVTSNFGARDK
jgi:hypothetical protein